MCSEVPDSGTCGGLALAGKLGGRGDRRVRSEGACGKALLARSRHELLFWEMAWRLERRPS